MNRTRKRLPEPGEESARLSRLATEPEPEEAGAVRVFPTWADAMRAAREKIQQAPSQEPPISPLTNDELKLAEEEYDRRAAERQREIREQDRAKYGDFWDSLAEEIAKEKAKFLKPPVEIAIEKPYTDIEQPQGFVRKDDSIIAGIPEHRRGLLAKITDILREGDEARIAALRRAVEAPATERPAPQPFHLPDEIPKAQQYRSRPKGQTLRQFLGLDPSEHPEGWPAPYIRAKILTQPDLSRLDPTAYGALYSTKEGRELQGLLPNKAQLLDEELSHVDRERIREANRLQRAMERRARAARA